MKPTPSLATYIEAEIIPRYDSFDRAHDRRHVRSVIDRSLTLARELGADPDMAYTVAAYHDTVLGMLEEQNIPWCYCELYNAVPNHLTLMPVVGGTEFQWSNATVESVTVTCDSGETCEYLVNQELMDVFRKYT